MAACCAVCGVGAEGGAGLPCPPLQRIVRGGSRLGAAAPWREPRGRCVGRPSSLRHRGPSGRRLAPPLGGWRMQGGGAGDVSNGIWGGFGGGAFLAVPRRRPTQPATAAAAAATGHPAGRFRRWRPRLPLPRLATPPAAGYRRRRPCAAAGTPPHEAGRVVPAWRASCRRPPSPPPPRRRRSQLLAHPRRPPPPPLTGRRRP